MSTSPDDFNPALALVGSLMFCALPLWYIGFLVQRRLGWQSLDARTVAFGLLTGGALFAFFVAWLGLTHGVHPGVLGMLGWQVGVYQAARRNEIRRRFYVSPGRATPRKRRERQHESNKL